MDTETDKEQELLHNRFVQWLVLIKKVDRNVAKLIEVMKKKETDGI